MGFLALAQQGMFGNYDPRRQHALAPSPASLAGGYGQPVNIAPVMAPPMPQQPTFTTSPTPPQQRRANTSPLAALTPEFAASYNALQQPVGMPGASQPSPFSLNQPTPELPKLNMTAMGAPSAGAGPKGPMPGAPAQQRPGFMQRLGDLPNNSLFQLGMSLLGNAQNGGDWGQVGQDMMAFSDRQRQRQIQDNEMRRQKVNDGRQETLWSQTQEDRERENARRAEFNQYVETVQDPELRAILEAGGSENWGDVLMGERTRRFQEQENARARAAGGGELGRMFQNRDAVQIADMNDAAAHIQSQSLDALRTLRQNIVAAGEAATGQPIDYTTRIAINRVFNGQGPERMALETWRGRMLTPALEMLPPGPATDRDVALVMEAFANPNMQLGSALNLIDERIAAAERQVVRAQAANDFFRDAGGLTGRRNSAGQDWPTYLASRMEGLGYSDRIGADGRPRGDARNSGQTGSFPTPPQQAIQALRADSSAQRRRQFDEIFGPGAAARYLANGNQTRPSFQPSAPVLGSDRNNPYGAY